MNINITNIINDYKIQGEWRIHSGNTIIKHKDSDETHTMHTKGDNIEIMMGSERDEIIEELFKSLLQRYQEGLEKSMRGSEFIFDCVDAL